MVRWARLQIDQGLVPLDGWYPNLSFGLAQFHHYQVLGHIIGGYLSLPFGVETTYYWALYLLLALWPVSVYLGARLLSLDRWTAGAASVFAPLIVSTTGYGFETSSYTWQGLGVWSQLWGMWTLPLALGLSWRAVDQGRHYIAAVMLVALTIAFHFLNGYLALMAIGVWFAVRPAAPWRRLARAAAVGLGGLLVASWVVVPLVQDARFSGNLEFYRNTFWFDSYGLAKVMGWLLSGEIYDHGRIPVLTVLVAIGLVVCGVRARRDVRARALLGFWGLSLLLFFGKSVVGPILNLMPGGQDLPLHRYLAAVQLGGLFIAGVALVSIGQGVFWLLHRYAPRRRYRAAFASVAVALMGAAVLYPAWSELVTYEQGGEPLMAGQLDAEATDGADLARLISMIQAKGDGRAYAGTKANWGHQYAIAYVPVYKELENADVDQLGMWLNTTSISSDVEARFDEGNPAQYDLFNIRYLILPSGRQPSVAAKEIARSGRHILYQVATSGFLEVVDTIGPPVVADRTNMGQANAAILHGADLAARRLPTVAFDGAAAADPTLVPGAAPSTSPGEVMFQGNQAADGTYGGFVTAARSAVVMLKVSYDPRWTAQVDGKDVPTQMVAPSFVGVPVSAGSHSITFKYQPYPYYPELLLLGALTLLALYFAPRWGVLAPTGDPGRATSSRSATRTPAPQVPAAGTTPEIPIL
jgi:Bacterial membrane protein YfhO